MMLAAKSSSASPRNRIDRSGIIVFQSGCIPDDSRDDQGTLSCSQHLTTGTSGTITMILGIGNDMIDIRRIEQTLARFGSRFTDRVFTTIERERSQRRAQTAASFAKRFAAKEACSKALGTGLRRGVFWRDMGVVNLPGGRPTLNLTGGAARQLETMVPPNHSAKIDLTLTDDFPWAQAIVIISAIPDNQRAN